MITPSTNFLRLALACTAILCGACRSSIATDSVTIESEKALKKITGNWYDADKGAYRPPVLSKPLDDSIRRNGWVGKKKVPKPPNPNKRSWSWANLGFGELAGWLVFGGLGTILLIGLIAIAYHFFGGQFPAMGRKTVKSAIKVDMTKVEDLPFEVSATNDDPLAYAQSLMLAGHYNQAVVYLYGYMLLALDQSRKIHLQKGKTNRMYLRELRSETELQSIVNTTMLAFEDVFFGRHDIDRARFELLWQQLDAFHHLLSPASNSVGSTAEVATA